MHLDARLTPPTYRRTELQIGSSRTIRPIYRKNLHRVPEHRTELTVPQKTQILGHCHVIWEP